MIFFSVGCIFSSLSIILGAIMEHVLANHLNQNDLKLISIAGKYLFYSAVPLLIVAVSNKQFKWPKYIGYTFILGTILFSGSLISYSFFKLSFLMMITPIGGVLMISAWILFLISGIFNKEFR